MLLARHRSLVKPLEPSSRAAALLGPNALMPAASRSSTMPAHQRRLRADHDEVDLVRLAERDHRRVVGDVERDALGLARDAGVARRAIEPVGERACRDLPGQRVLAPAGAEEEDVHAGASTSMARRAGGTRPPTASTGPPRRGRAGVICLAAMKVACAALRADVCGPGRAGRRRRLHAGKPARGGVPRPKGGIVHVSPYPQSKRAASVWASDACWRDCTAELHLEDGIPASARPSADACRPHLDACDRACQRSCRSPRRAAARLHRLVADGIAVVRLRARPRAMRPAAAGDRGRGLV